MKSISPEVISGSNQSGSPRIFHADWTSAENEPLVSCVIPNFNNGTLIEETVSACLDQTYSRREVIVVDDGSTDGSIDALRQFGDKIQIICQKNQGVSVARNVGAYYSSGSLLCFCDSDDVWLSRKLEQQVNIITQNPIASAVYTDYEPFGSVKDVVDSINSGRARQALCGANKLWLENPIIISSVLLRRAAFIRSGGFRAGLFYPADWMLWTALEVLGPILYIDEVLVRYRLHTGSSSVQARLSHVLELVAAKFFHRIMMIAKGASSSEEESELSRASEHIDHEFAHVFALLDKSNKQHEVIREFFVRLGAGFRLRSCLQSLRLLLRKRVANTTHTHS